MRHYPVRKASAYAREEELTLGHCIASGNKGGCSGLAKKIAAGYRFNSDKLTGVLGLESAS